MSDISKNYLSETDENWSDYIELNFNWGLFYKKVAKMLHLPTNSIFMSNISVENTLPQPKTLKNFPLLQTLENRSNFDLESPIIYQINGNSIGIKMHVSELR